MENTTPKGFILFYDYADCLSLLSMEERGVLLTALLENTDGKTAELAMTPAVEIAYRLMSAQIHRSKRVYESRAEASRENGKRGGRPKKDTAQTQETQENPRKPENLKTLTNTNTSTSTNTSTNTETLSSPASPSAALADAAPPDSVVSPLKVRISSVQLENEFERIWKIYPRKEGKKGARAAFEKVRRRGVSFEEIEAGAKKYAEVAGQREMKYIKHGSTWFAGECWNDEVKEDGYRYDAESARIAAEYAGCFGIEL